MITETEVMRAIVDLRNHMGLSQTMFAANVLGKTLPTQQRYERLVPPPAAELVVLVAAARKAGRADLAEVFKAAAIATVPPEIQTLIRERDDREGRSSQKTTEEGPLDNRRAGRR